MRLTLTKKENKWTQETVYFTLKLYFNNRNMEYKTQLLQTQHVKVMWPTFKLKCLLLNPDVNKLFVPIYVTFTWTTTERPKSRRLFEMEAILVLLSVSLFN